MGDIKTFPRIVIKNFKEIAGAIPCIINFPKLKNPMSIGTGTISLNLIKY